MTICHVTHINITILFFGTEIAVANIRKTEINHKQKQNKTMAVKPLSDRVLVKPNPAEEKTAGGLFIPDTAKEKPLMGKVIAAGPGTADVKMEVKVGDVVMYGKYAGTELNYEGEDYLVMKQSDIIAVIE